MIDLLLNETFIRSAIPWFAAATPVLAIVLYILGLGRKGRTAGHSPEEASATRDEGQDAVSSVDAANRGSDTRVRRWRAYVLAIGLLGPVVWLLWIVYESIMDVYGFASVKGLMIVLGLFVLVGLLAGWLLGRTGQIRKSE